MKTALSAALLLAAAPALAQMPGSRMQRIPGISDQGNAILNEAMNAPDQQLNEIMSQQRSIRDQLDAAIAAPTINVDRIATLIKQREDVQTRYRQLADARTIAALRQLPAADRGPFLRAISGPPQGGGAPRQ